MSCEEPSSSRTAPSPCPHCMEATLSSSEVPSRPLVQINRPVHEDYFPLLRLPHRSSPRDSQVAGLMLKMIMSAGQRKSNCVPLETSLLFSYINRGFLVCKALLAMKDESSLPTKRSLPSPTSPPSLPLQNLSAPTLQLKASSYIIG